MPDARFHDHSGPPARGRRVEKKTGGDEALGRSRGGFSTKLHLAVDAEGRPVELTLTPGQEHDITQASRLLADHEPDYVIADKAYDCDAFIAEIHDRGSVAVIPARAGRTVQRRLLRRIYRLRNQAERSVNRFKHFRRVATRYEKTARNYLGFVQLAALCCWIG
jgi:transposase